MLMIGDTLASRRLYSSFQVYMYSSIRTAGRLRYWSDGLELIEQRPAWSRTQHRQLRSPIEDALISAVFGALSELEPLCDNALYKLTLTLTLTLTTLLVPEHTDASFFSKFAHVRIWAAHNCLTLNLIKIKDLEQSTVLEQVLGLHTTGAW